MPSYLHTSYVVGRFIGTIDVDVDVVEALHTYICLGSPFRAPTTHSISMDRFDDSYRTHA